MTLTLAIIGVLFLLIGIATVVYAAMALAARCDENTAAARRIEELQKQWRMQDKWPH